MARFRRRKRLRPGALMDCWQAGLPSPRTDWRSLDFLVVDAEMSSLDPQQGELLSLGWVAVRTGAIDLGSASHRVLRASSSVGQSAVIHQLRDLDLADGEKPESALDALLQAARGRILVFHNARLDLAFLDPIACSCHGTPLLLPVVDTLRAEQRLLSRRSMTPRAGDLTLTGCRARYGLDGHAAHNALGDALATAELLLAHASSRGAGICLGDLL
ncbi:3'-5' exonuclease [Chromatocurvus halotolerans]|uniref:3'-5' exonuclease n=1 Tax=Chromatocurvus halotolerans TaxID=1132028 RepID=UPI001F0C6DCF|nr:3'-5' exonuclease [Chromatocurvus halotolerans]